MPENGETKGEVHVTTFVVACVRANDMFTPARLKRELELDEERLDELPSLPGGPTLDFSSDDLDLDQSSVYVTPLRDAFNRTEQAPSRASHSTPPPLTKSLTSSSARSTSSTERFAASLQSSRGSSGSQNKRQNDASFDISKISHVSHGLADANTSVLIYDEESGLGAPTFGVPVPPEVDDGPVSDAMESISLSSSSKKTDESIGERVVSLRPLSNQ